MRTYYTPAFIETIANKTRTPVMVIMTEGACASSMRYTDVAVDAETRGELYDTDQAFLTFDSVDEANAKFDEILAAYPAAGQTTLGIDVMLAIPGVGIRQFEQNPGDAEGRIVREPKPMARAA